MFTTDFEETLRGFCYNEHGSTDIESVCKDSWFTLCVNLQKVMCELDSGHKLSVFIKLSQELLTNFAEKIFNEYLSLGSSNSDEHLKRKKVFSELEDEILKVLEFFRCNFPGYFNHSSRVPCWLLYVDQDIQVKTGNILSGLDKYLINKDLKSILTNFCYNIQTEGVIAIENWDKYIYCKRLVAELDCFLDSVINQQGTEGLIKILVGYDFNSLDFYEFMLKYTASIAGDDQPVEDRENNLLNFLKLINDVRPESQQRYNSDAPSLNESVSAAIRREIKTLKKKRDLDEWIISDAKEKGKLRHYFEVVTTIEEFFFLIKVMLAVRFLKTNYNANIYRFVESCIKTDTSTGASHGYMRNIMSPSWTFSPKVIRKMRAWLMTMVTYIDTHFTKELRLF